MRRSRNLHTVYKAEVTKHPFPPFQAGAGCWFLLTLQAYEIPKLLYFSIKLCIYTNFDALFPTV
jgi:hypothetical protein